MKDKYLEEALAITNIGLFNISKSIHSLKESESEFKVADSLNNVNKELTKMMKDTENTVIEKLEAGCNEFYKRVDNKLNDFNKKIVEFIDILEEKGRAINYDDAKKLVSKEIVAHSENGTDDVDNSFTSLEKDFLKQATDIKRSMYIIDEYKKFFSGINNKGVSVTDIKQSLLYSKIGEETLLERIERIKNTFFEKAANKLQMYLNKFREIYTGLTVELPDYEKYIKPSLYGVKEKSGLTVADMGNYYFTVARFLNVSRNSKPELGL